MSTAKPTFSEQEAYLRAKMEENIAAELNDFFSSIIEHSYKYSGAGSYYGQFHKTLSKIDRYGIRAITPNHEYAGLTFITRPELNFSAGNLRQSRLMSLLETQDPLSMQFMIRMLLDSRLAKENITFMDLASTSPLIDNDSPFITPLTNRLESISGFPSMTIETATSEGGLFSEDITVPIGSDRNYKSFDLTLAFDDVQGGVCAAIIQMWAAYIDKVCRGEMVQYTDDIDSRRMGWTCSIYRFLLDPSKRYITRWCKCTGCFPIIRSSGAVFDYSRTEGFVEAARKFTATFKCNHMGEENDPIIIKEFNTLVKRFCPDIDDGSRRLLNTTPQDNYLGIPYIVPSEYGPRLDFRARVNEGVDTVFSDLEKTAMSVKQKKIELENQIETLKQQYESEESEVFYV